MIHFVTLLDVAGRKIVITFLIPAYGNNEWMLFFVLPTHTYPPWCGSQQSIYFHSTTYLNLYFWTTPAFYKNCELILLRQYFNLLHTMTSQH
jgi:hypothetical protein